MPRRIVAALAPGLALVGDCGQPVLGELRFARDRLRLAANFGASCALARNHLVHCGELLLDLLGGAERGQRLFGGGACRVGLGPRRRKAQPRLLQRG